MTTKIEQQNKSIISKDFGRLYENLSPRAKILLETMTSVYLNHKSLGEGGKEKTAENQFGDMAMVADVQAEEKVLAGAKKYSDVTGKGIVFRGEEMGNGFVKKGEIEYWLKEDKSSQVEAGELWVMDGLDGSENYKDKTEWPYGTMVGIADKIDPKYNDFKTVAICMEEEGQIVLATTEGEQSGVFVFDLINNKVTKLTPFNQSGEFDSETVLADNYFNEAKKLIEAHPELGQRRIGSTAATVVSMAIRNLVTNLRYPKMNELHEALVDVTRKGNLEQSIVYLMLKLLGGDVLDINGHSIGNNDFKTWGQGNNEHLPIFPMANPNQFSKLKDFLQL